MRNDQRGGARRDEAARDAAFDAALREAVGRMPRATPSPDFVAAVMADVRARAAAAEGEGERRRAGRPATLAGGVAGGVAGGLAAVRARMKEACDRWVFCAALGGAVAGLLVTMVGVNLSLLGEVFVGAPRGAVVAQAEAGFVGAGSGGRAAAGDAASPAGPTMVAGATIPAGESMQLFYADLGSTGFSILPTGAMKTANP